MPTASRSPSSSAAISAGASCSPTTNGICRSVVEEPVTLSIDKLAPIAGTAKVVDAHGILVPLENADPVVEAMRGGHTLAVVTPAGDVASSFPARATPSPRLRDCVSENLEAEKAGGIEAKAHGGRQRPRQQAVHRERGGGVRLGPARHGRHRRLSDGRSGARPPCRASTWCGPMQTASSRRWSATRTWAPSISTRRRMR